MAGLELTAIVEAAARADFEARQPLLSWDAQQPLTQHNVRERLLPAVTAAATTAAASVLREAGDVLIEQKPGLPVMHDVRAWLHENADRIERGDQ